MRTPVVVTMSLVALILTAAITAPTANAAPLTEQEHSEFSSLTGNDISIPVDARPLLTASEYLQITSVLQSAGARPNPDGTVTYSVDGLSITFSNPIRPAPVGRVHPDLSVGGPWYNPTIYFNHSDQVAILAGAGFAMGAAFCAIPGVGWGLCAAFGAVITAAFAYIVDSGLCPSRLAVPAFWGSARCVR